MFTSTRVGMGIQFRVHEVEPARDALHGARAPLSLATEEPWGNGFPIATSFGPREAVIPLQHSSLLSAVRLAYGQHYPLALSPDIVWLTIAQGFALHVREHAEELRRDLARHEGKLRLAVDTSNARCHEPAWWRGLITEFATRIGEQTGELHGLITCDFSTTGPVERSASQIVLMDVTSPYFRYAVDVICGIPSITLEGTPEDWERLRWKVERLKHYGLLTWAKSLVPICEQFIRAARGTPDVDFWRQILFEHTDCDDDKSYSGWITALYPYLRAENGYRPNSALLSERAVSITDVPPNLSRVPVEMSGVPGLGKTDLLAGLLGVTQDPETLVVRPLVGWAVLVPEQEQAVVMCLQDERHLSTPPLPGEEMRAHLSRLTGDAEGGVTGLGEIYSLMNGAALHVVDGRPVCRILPLEEVTAVGPEGQLLRFCDVEDGSFFAVERERMDRIVGMPGRVAHFCRNASSDERPIVMRDSAKRFFHQALLRNGYVKTIPRGPSKERGTVKRDAPRFAPFPRPDAAIVGEALAWFKTHFASSVKGIDDATIYCEIGISWRSMGRFRDALEALSRGLEEKQKTRKKELELAYELADMYECDKQPEKARTHFEHVERIDPMYEDPRGSVRERLERLKRTIS